MGTLPLHSPLADRILAGYPPPEESPAGLAEVAAIVRALRVEPTVGELVRERETVAAVAAIVRSQDEPVPAAPPQPRRTFAVPRLRFALAVVLSLLGATTALAAAGELPGRAQDFASNVLGTVGIHVPKSDDEPTKAPRPGPSGDETGPRSQIGGAGTADEEPSGTVSPQQGETETGPQTPSGSDRAEDEGSEQPAPGTGTTLSPGAPPSDEEEDAVPDTEGTDDDDDDEPAETPGSTAPTTTDERKPKPPKEDRGPQGAGSAGSGSGGSGGGDSGGGGPGGGGPGGGGPGGGAAGAGVQTETEADAEEEDDERPARPPPPPPRNPRATDAEDGARVGPRDRSADATAGRPVISDRRPAKPAVLTVGAAESAP